MFREGKREAVIRKPGDLPRQTLFSIRGGAPLREVMNFGFNDYFSEDRIFAVSFQTRWHG